MRNKKADILHEQIIFIVLNLMFFSTMIGFLYLQGSSTHLEEEKIAKQVSLLIDISKSGTEIELNLESFFDKLDGISKERSVEINNEKNIVIVRGSSKSYFEYSFFNNVDVEYNFNGNYLVMNIK